MILRDLFVLYFACGALCGWSAQPIREVITGPYVQEGGPWGNPDTTLTLPQRQHPYLFADEAVLARAVSRAQRWPAAKRQMRKLLKQADTEAAAKLEIPDVGGQWAHHYVCKDCGIRLSYEGKKHVCGRCSREYRGWPYDEVIAARLHDANLEAVQYLGLAYGFTKDEKYAEKAREILLGYADRYTSFPIHDNKGGQMEKGARLTAQTLNEAISMIAVAWGYDLVYNSPRLSPADRDKIENRFLRPAAAVIRRNDMGISNWQTWHNAAFAAIGFCLRDKLMVDHALNGRSGFHFQMKNSVMDDGFWYEGAASYHFYALDALRYTVQAMQGAGMEYAKRPKFQSLFEAPLYYVLPDGRFPAVNDSDPVELRTEARLYEVAYSWQQNPAYAAVAAAGGRASLEALLWGADELPEAPDLPATSRNFPELGAVMLRQGSSKDQLCVHMDYGPHGGGHGHPDKLGIIFFANGFDAMPDAGRLDYGAPLHNQWYKTTLAHNTLVVDKKNQKPAQGRLTQFLSGDGFSSAQAVCDTASDDVRLTRTLILTPDYLIDLFAADSGSSHTYDLAVHAYGTQATDAKLRPMPVMGGATAGYQVLKNLRWGIVDRRWNVDHLDARGNLRITSVLPEGTGVLLADGVAGRQVTSCPLTLLRQHGKSAFFASLIEPYKNSAAAEVTRFEVKGDLLADDRRVEIQVLRGREQETFRLLGGVVERVVH